MRKLFVKIIRKLTEEMGRRQKVCTMGTAGGPNKPIATSIPSIDIKVIKDKL